MYVSVCVGGCVCMCVYEYICMGVCVCVCVVCICECVTRLGMNPERVSRNQAIALPLGYTPRPLKHFFFNFKTQSP